MPTSILAVNECFYTFQGEGVHMGRAAFFVRTQGCDQGCWFCDAASTWHRDWIPDDVERLTPEDVCVRVEAGSDRGAIVVLTGGEPCLYNLAPTIELLHHLGRYVAVETAGHRPIPANVDWITLSPKPFATHPTRENVHRADEFKIIVSDEQSLRDGLDCIEGHNDHCRIWLHPEWSSRKQAAPIIVEAVKRYPELRAGYQIHKLYMADLEDPAARKEPVPLGGVGGSPW